ncbi:MAG: hypothetical protein AAGJ40_09915 [Planctomycetota bacterium]
MTQLPTTSADPASAFGCIVYVRRDASGQTRARAANLDNIEVIAPSEPAALGKIVAAVKQHIQSCQSAGKPIDWIDPPPPLGDGEQRRFLPLHL